MKTWYGWMHEEATDETDTGSNGRTTRHMIDCSIISSLSLLCSVALFTSLVVEDRREKKMMMGERRGTARVNERKNDAKKKKTFARDVKTTRSVLKPAVFHEEEPAFCLLLPVLLLFGS